MSDLIKMEHPTTKQTATVPVAAFEAAWSKKGWRPARNRKKPKPEDPDDNPTPTEE